MTTILKKQLSLLEEHAKEKQGVSKNDENAIKKKHHVKKPKKSRTLIEKLRIEKESAKKSKFNENMQMLLMTGSLHKSKDELEDEDMFPKQPKAKKSPGKKNKKF